MTSDNVIANLAKENLELKNRVDNFTQNLRDINGILYCVGGPLNDNIKKFSNEQLKTFVVISNLIKFGE